MSESTQDEARDALRWFRDRMFGELITVCFTLASQTHGEELRKAIGSVFDLGAVEDLAKRSMAVVTQIQHQVGEHRDQTRGEMLELIGVLHKALDRLEQRIDGIERATERLERRLNKAAKLVR
jgi:hypothetical protein